MSHWVPTNSNQLPRYEPHEANQTMRKWGWRRTPQRLGGGLAIVAAVLLGAVDRADSVPARTEFSAGVRGVQGVGRGAGSLAA